jgi:putative NADH-flavin reductase
MEKTHLVSKVLIVLTAMLCLPVQSLHADENLKIVVFGASGRLGDVIVDEALERGYEVIGVSRNPEKLPFTHKNFTARKGDMMDVTSIKELARDAGAIVISISAKAPDNRPENSVIVPATKNVIEALSQLENKPYIVQMGSANLMYGSTFEEISKNMKNAPFPFEEGTVMYAVLIGHQMSLESYRESNLDWTIIAPPMKVMGIYKEPDKVSTKASYRTSTSGPLVDAEGNKTIYVRDLAKATINEIEDRKFVGQVFTVGY